MTPTIKPAWDNHGVGKGVSSLAGKRQVTHDDGTDDGVAIALEVMEIARNYRLTQLLVDLTEVFDGTTDLCSLGILGDLDGFMDTAFLDLTTLAVYDSQGDAQPFSTELGRDPQTDRYDVIANLETNSDTTTGEMDIFGFGWIEDTND